MIDVIAFTQLTLDTALAEIPLHSFWLLRQEIDGEANPDEYIVYTAVEHEPDAGADGENLIYRSYITLRYFCRESWIGIAEKAALIRSRLTTIRAAMIEGGFDCSSGLQNVGDVDGISFTTFVLTAEYVEADRDNS